MSSVPETPPSYYCIKYQSQKTDSIGIKKKKEKRACCFCFAHSFLWKLFPLQPDMYTKISIEQQHPKLLHGHSSPTNKTQFPCAAGTREQSHPLHTGLNPAWTKLQSSRMPSVTTANKEEELRCNPEGNSAAT